MKQTKYLLIPVIALSLIIFLMVGLFREEIPITSTYLNKTIPNIELPELFQFEQKNLIDYCKDKYCLVNIWASWCSACVTEHKELLALSNLRKANIQLTLVGINYKDQRDHAIQWLNRYQNPYSLILFDQSGNTGFELGVYGVPESYLISPDTIVMKKWVGPITFDIVTAHLNGLVLREVAR